MSVKNKLIHILLLQLFYLSDGVPLYSTNIVDYIVTSEKLLENNLVSEISAISANGGLEQYHLGLKNEDKNLNITQLINKYGDPVEEHDVATSDGYILTMFRIPSTGPAVLLMHGFLNSADDWVTAGPQSALAYLLAEKGYDVWLGNARGNKHSRHHLRLSSATAQFWDFSWDEIGRYDLPAMIDYVLHATGQRRLKYVGHSQGTTAFFVMCSERPEYNDKVSVMIALSVVAWVSHLDSPLFRLISPVAGTIDVLLSATGVYEFLPDHGIIKTAANIICGNTLLATILCSNIMFLIGGFNYSQLNVTNTPVLFNHMPAGSSKKQVIHYEQEIVSGHFRKYDYGAIKNLQQYGSKSPPDYPVEEVTAPVAIFFSDGDWLSNPIDVEIIRDKLPNLVDYYKVPTRIFSHTDYLFGKDVKELVYLKVLEYLNNY